MMPRMRFEKWQALGNDYLIVEASELGFPLTAAAVRRLCDRHTGPGADGVLELSPPDAPGFVARLRIFNPDGSEAELSGNGAREAIMYLRRSGATDQDRFSIQTAAGEIRPTILGPNTCRVDMGRARLQSEHFPGGPADGAGEVAGQRFQHVAIGNPQCAIHVAGREQLAALEDARADRSLAGLAPPRDVRAVRELRVVLDRRPDRRQVEGQELLEARHADRALRVADRDVLEREARHLARAVLAPAREVLRAQPRPAHVDAAGGRAEDRRADLARGRLDGERVAVGRARAAEVHDRLPRAVARKLGLGAVGIEDPQAGDEPFRVGRRELEHAVRARARVAVAEPAHHRGREREREVRRLDDHVVVA